MARLSGLGVRRMRSLYDLGEPLPITPITILLGRNSVGKSTFARVLPLLRQSVERKKRGPILWFDELVDFGSLQQTITRNENSLEIVLELDGLQDDSKKGFLKGGYRASREHNPIKLNKVKVTLTLAEDESSGTTQAKEVKVVSDGIEIKVVFNGILIDFVSVGEKKYELKADRVLAYVEQGELLPRIIFLEKKKRDESEFWYQVKNPWRADLVSLLHSQVHQNTSRDKMSQLAYMVPVGSLSEMSSSVKHLPGPPTWNSNRELLSRQDGPFMKNLQTAVFAANVDGIFRVLDEAIGVCARGVRYLKPLRANMERYYRRVDLAVSEIDPEGRNLAMFLDSLSESQLRNFRDWVQENLGIDVEPKREGGHVFLMAKGAHDSGMSNVADMGFGLSQVLPIAAQLWVSRFGRVSGLGRADVSHVVIEQPELHLHPAFQAKLADVFAGVVTEEVGSQTEMTPPSIVVETHSQQLVNRLGQLVELGRLDRAMVSIVLFEPNPCQVGTSTARVCSFDESGILQGWPFGFFEPDF